MNDNQGGEETTVINELHLFGLPVEATNMNAFKKVRLVVEFLFFI